MSTSRLYLLAIALLALSHAAIAHPASAANYFRAGAGGGAFTDSLLWSPHLPPLLRGPGDADDSVTFDLGVAPINRYSVTGVTGINDRLAVGRDSLTLDVLDYILVNSGGSVPSFALGLANQDQADVILTGASDATFQTGSASVGYAGGSLAKLVVNQLQWFANGDAYVGHGGLGVVGIQNGGVAAAVNVWMGSAAQARGEMTVEGAGSSWSLSNQLTVGVSGEAELKVYEGGTVTTAFAVIGSQSVGRGSVLVSGANATWNNSSAMNVGLDGQGALLVANGGIVSNGPVGVGVYPTSNGEIDVLGGGQWLTTGTLSIGGSHPGSGLTNGNGKVTIKPGGSASTTGTTTIYANGILNLQGGTFATPTIDRQGGQFNWTGGDLGVGFFQGALTNQGGRLTPGGSGAGATTVNGDYAQFASGTLNLDIGGLAAGAMHDLVGVTGSAVLGGQLTLNLVNGFVPGPNSSVSVLNAAGGLFGVFANVASGQRLMTLDGVGSFSVHYGLSSPFNANQVVLADFQPTFTADFDHDGDVDADDLGQWQNDFGVNDFSDADSDGDSDGNDFLLWQQQLGGGSMATASVAAVPEPTGAVLLLLPSIAVISQSRPLKTFLV